MKNLHLLDDYRDTSAAVRNWYCDLEDWKTGVFRIPSPISGELTVIASADGEWEHVSVSRTNRSPNWPEMCHIKGLFFDDDETVMQLHVPAADHVNVHPYCLHLWRPLGIEIPRPYLKKSGVPSL